MTHYHCLTLGLFHPSWGCPSLIGLSGIPEFTPSVNANPRNPPVFQSMRHYAGWLQKLLFSLPFLPLWCMKEPTCSRYCFQLQRLLSGYKLSQELLLLGRDANLQQIIKYQVMKVNVISDVRWMSCTPDSVRTRLLCYSFQKPITPV